MMHNIPTNENSSSKKIDIEKSETVRADSSSDQSLQIVKQLQALRTVMRKKAEKSKEKLGMALEKAGISDTPQQQENAMEIEAEGLKKEEEMELFPELEPSEEFKNKFFEDFDKFRHACQIYCSKPEHEWPAHFERFNENPNNLSLLAKIYFLTGEHYYEANSLQLWTDIEACLNEEERAVVGNVKSFYQRNLFLFEKHTHSTSQKKSIRKFLNIDLSKLTDPVIYHPAQAKDPNFLQDVLSRQSTLLKGFEDVYKINNELFTLEAISKAHGLDEIDVVFQNPNLYGFRQDRNIAYQTKRKMSIQEYSKYQLEAEKHNPQNIPDKEGLIQFGVNIDIENWDAEMKELLEKLPTEFLFDTEMDMMKYLTYKIKGVSLPQLYMKVEGVWTGGHEENVRLRAININHGPGCSIWYTIKEEHVPLFRALIKEKHGLDIHKNEGLWFADIDTCIKNGIEIQYFVQEPGDIVVLGPGCLHWVRCTGVAVNSAWNFCTRDKIQFEKALQRDAINQKIGFNSIIPIRHISMKLLCNETFSIPEDLRIFLIEHLKPFFVDEMAYYEEHKKKYPKVQFKLEPKNSAVYNCLFCNYETMNFYIFVEGGEEPTFACLNCAKTHLGQYHWTKRFHYFKLYPKIVESLPKILDDLAEIQKKYSSLEEYLQEQNQKENEIAEEEQIKILQEKLATKPTEKRRLQNQKNSLIHESSMVTKPKKLEGGSRGVENMVRTSPDQIEKVESGKSSVKKSSKKDSASKKESVGKKGKDLFGESETKLVKASSGKEEDHHGDDKTNDPDKTYAPDLIETENAYRIKKKVKRDTEDSNSNTMTIESSSNQNSNQTPAKFDLLGSVFSQKKMEQGLNCGFSFLDQLKQNTSKFPQKL